MWIAIILLIVFLILLFNFPLFTIGATLAGWGLYEWNTNKKLKAKSRKPAAILSAGLVMALTGCFFTDSTPNDQVTSETEEAESAEVAAEAEQAEKDRLAAEKEAEEKKKAEEEAAAKKKAEEEAAAKKQDEEEAAALAAQEQAEQEAAAKAKAEEEAAALAAQEKAEAEAAAAAASTPPAQEAEIFDNCTHLRTVYPNGVDKDHPAYQNKMDRDKDDWACEN